MYIYMLPFQTENTTTTIQTFYFVLHIKKEQKTENGSPGDFL